MDIIESVEKKVKKEKKISYSFSIENENFEANYVYGKKPVLTLLRNGTQIGIVETPNSRFPLSIDTEQGQKNITVWIEAGGSSWLTGKTTGGVGIEVDGKPVQNTLSDPSVHIKGGKTGLLIVLFLFALKTIFHTFSGDMITAVLYLIPVFILLIAILKYQKWLKFALISGAALAIFEMIDFAVGVFQSGFQVSFIFWFLFRLSGLVLIFTALKWSRKVKESKKEN